MKKTFIYLFMFCLFLAGCGDDSANNSTSKNTGEDKVDEQVEKETKREQKNEEFELKQIGETFKLKDWDVTLESFEFNKKVENDIMSSEAEEGNEFLILNFKVVNNGTEADQLMKPREGVTLKAVYNDKYTYDDLITLVSGDLHLEDVRPLSTVEGFAVVPMPDNVVEATESIDLYLKQGDSKVQINIR